MRDTMDPFDIIVPRYIALCGNPKSGKTEVQNILKESYGTHPIDDGFPLREFAVNNLGLTWDQVLTQKGKLEYVEILGRRWQVREVLGELGNRFESMFGKHVMPFMAVQQTYRVPGAPKSFSFGSVRRDQGLYYKERGGLVIGIRNPQAGPSIYEFDQFDHSVVDLWIDNDALARGWSVERAREDLRMKVWAALAGHTLKARSFDPTPHMPKVASFETAGAF